MDLHQFIQNFAAQFNDTDVSEFRPETRFKELKEWSSLIALSIIAMIDEELSITIKGDDIRQAKTINDLFGIVKTRA